MDALMATSLAFILLGIFAYAIVWWETRDERKKAKEEKLMSDKEYNEQQKLHEGV